MSEPMYPDSLDQDPAWTADTVAVQAGRPARVPGAPMNAPITLSSTYVHDASLEYGRDGNAGWGALEAALGALDGGRAVTFASGRAAATALAALVPAGGIVVLPTVAYYGVRTIFERLASRGRIEVRAVSPDDTTAGTWVLWYAQAHPERVRRLVLLGATPLLPATHVPAPMLAVAAPTDVQAPLQMPPPSAETVVRNMGVFGEAETIVNYPDQIDALVAAGHDRLASSVSLAELRSLISPTGWQPQLVVSPDELGALKVPTMLIWGDRDPLGGANAARTTATTIPGARLEPLPSGHAPWLGHPDQTADLVNDFVR